MFGLNFQLSTLLHKLWALKSAGEVHSPILSLLLRSSETYILQLQPRGKSALSFFRTMSRCHLRCIREAGTAPEIQWDLQVALCRPLARAKTYEPSKLPLSTMLRTLQKVFTRKKGYTVYAILHPNPSKSTDESSYVTSHHIISYLMTHYSNKRYP